MVMTFLICIVGSLVPSHDKILKLKISKLKNELVTEENVKSGINRVDEIAKKLEKKYLE